MYADIRFDPKTVNAVAWIQNHYESEETIQHIIFGHESDCEVSMTFETIEEWEKAIAFFEIEKIKDMRKK